MPTRPAIFSEPRKPSVRSRSVACHGLRGHWDMSRGSGDEGDHTNRDSEQREPRADPGVSPLAWRHLVVARPRVQTSYWQQVERGNMWDKYLPRHPDTEGCVSLHPRHPCVSRPCNLIGRPRPGIYLSSFSNKKNPGSIIHRHILPAIITTQGGVYREEKKFN